ncbi:MAG: bifunctional DNA-binding transcriptional regulator/O6-methylguanine-DNA methyltransferase Ada [Aquisalinus sp.]|nr:bifunctional DNA-binding transcriptional regulator/O6-methylguanine-DNA methyltransferase Ada [Aquisalinus sp.]
MSKVQQNRFVSEDARWKAICSRDVTAEGAFWVAVRTTGVYCRPGCPARLPRRENVDFYETQAAARAAGFRPCKRCQPDDPPLAERQARLVARAANMIEQAETPPTLDELSNQIGVSPHHLHRLFKAQLGITPKQYATAKRARKLQAALAAGTRVTDAVYDAGFNAPSRMYEQSVPRLGMTPGRARQKGQGEEVRFTLAESWLGRTLVAATEKGICSIQFGETDEEMMDALRACFPLADFTEAETGSAYADWVEQTLAFIEKPLVAPSMPLDVRGTAFQEQVWRALMRVQPGETRTYGEIAKSIGKPKAVRAVASACGANRLAVVIPCHRIIGKDGAMSGYRWGIKRKEQLLERERG